MCDRREGRGKWILVGKDGENSEASPSSVLAVTHTAPKDKWQKPLLSLQIFQRHMVQREDGYLKFLT